MKCAELIGTEKPPTIRREAVRMPTGLLGFEQIKDYVLASHPDEDPFGWLHVQDNSALAFVVIDPFVALPGYQPDIPQSDVEFLKLEQAEDALLVSIVTIHDDSRATVNLRGPVVINRHSHIGKQVIITNAAAYSVAHPLPVAGSVG
jgi:flagellar assembly factor FliW